MRILRFSALIAVVGVCAACSSRGATNTASEGSVDGGNAVDAGDGGIDASRGGGADAGGTNTGPQACTTSGTCPTDSPCCMRMDGGAFCVPDPQVAQACLCEKGSDCPSLTCAPSVDSTGQPTGPYVCVPDDGSPYGGCIGDSSCTAPYCCVTDSKGNQFCSMPCSSDSTCGSGHCDAFDFSASSCPGKTQACGI